MDFGFTMLRNTFARKFIKTGTDLDVRVQRENFLNCHISDSLILIFRKKEKGTDVKTRFFRIMQFASHIDRTHSCAIFHHEKILPILLIENLCFLDDTYLNKSFMFFARKIVVHEDVIYNYRCRNIKGYMFKDHKEWENYLLDNYSKRGQTSPSLFYVHKHIHYTFATIIPAIIWLNPHKTGTDLYNKYHFVFFSKKFNFDFRKLHMSVYIYYRR